MKDDWAWMMVMFKSGNIDHSLTICKPMMMLDAAHEGVGSSSRAAGPLPGAAPLDAGTAAGTLMNQPLMVHGWSTPGSPIPYGNTGACIGV
jgi:hypothetical protein